MTKFLGREETISWGIQTNGTTSVAPQVATRHLKNGVRPVVNKKKNTSAMGRPELNNGSAVMSKWTEGPIEQKLQDRSIGYPFLSLMGGVTTTANPDASTLVKNHAFPVVPGVDKFLTLGVKNLVDTRRIPNVVVSAMEFTSDAGSEGDWVQVAIDIVGGDKESAADTPGYLDETEFTQAHVTSKIGADLTAAAAATALETKNIKIRIERNRTPFVPHGSKSPVAYDIEPLKCTGELTLRYKLADLETNWADNTALALIMTFENTDVTIGTAAHPKLELKMPQINFETWDRTDDLDTYVEQTIAFDAELNTTAGYAVLPTLTNLQTAYAAA